jgi:plasmid stabilization system protein ParE
VAVKSRWTKGARQQFNDIWIELSTPEAMKSLEDAVQGGIAQIEMFPESAPQYLAFNNRPDIRMLVIGKYRLIYQIDEEFISVIAFLHWAPDSALD